MNENERKKLEKMREPVTVPEELKERILSVVDSNHMRDFLEKNCDYNICNWVDLIGGSPRAMDFKLVLLLDLLLAPMNEEAHRYLRERYQEAVEAMNRLWCMNPRKSVLLAYDMHSEYPDPFATEAIPCRTYDDFLRILREDYLEVGESLEEQSDYQDCFYRLDLYDEVNGKYERVITYCCSPNGKVQFYRRNHLYVMPGKRDYEKEWLAHPFSGREKLPYRKSPYRVGDILYVDMRPYFKPTYCLVSWISEEMPSDDSGIQCICLTAGGMVEQFGFNRGWFLPHVLSDPRDRNRQFFSPLYRAELYDGELPEDYAFLKAVSQRLKEEPELSQRIDDAFCKESEKYCKSVMFAYRPTVVERPKQGDEAWENDMLWHPNRKELQSWEDIGTAEGMTKEQLLALAGCSEPEDDSGSEKMNEE